MTDLIDGQRYWVGFERVLDRMGGIYRPEDIFERLRDGRMQAFSHENSVLVTEIHQFPRARTMDWILAVGDLKDAPLVHEKAVAFANRLDIPLIRAHGRRGWAALARENGWRLHTVSQVYHKDM